MAHPQSHVLDDGYIRVYSQLHPKEQRALEYTRRYKKEHPAWDNTSIRLCHFFSDILRKRNVSGPPVILDAGCGHGNYVIDEFRKNIQWACGVDIDQSVTAKNICLDEIRFSRLEAIPYQNESFDAVLCLWVLEHLQHPDEVLREIHRVLKPGGSFIFCTPNHLSAIVTVRKMLGSGIGVKINQRLFGRQEADIFPTAYQANDIKTLRRLLTEASFGINVLGLNFDPGYTAFNEGTYRLTTALEKTIGRLFPTLTRPHIVGHAIKPTRPSST